MLLMNKCLGTIAYMGGVMSVPERFAWSWTQMILYNKDYLVEPGEDVFYTRAVVSYHSAARNSLVEQIRGDWLLMLDTDHGFEPDIAVRLLHLADKHEVDVVTGFYQFKGPPHSPVIFALDEAGEKITAIGDWQPGLELLQVGSAGAGCLLVRRSVYERIERELSCKPFDVTPPYGEDHSFFLRLAKLGIKAYCAVNVKAYHLEVREIDLDDYDRSDVKFSDRMLVEGRN